MHLNILLTCLTCYCFISYTVFLSLGLTNAVRFTKKRLNLPPYEVSLEEIILTFLNLFCISEPEPSRTEDILLMLSVYVLSPASLVFALVGLSPKIGSSLIKKLGEVKLENKDAKFIEELKK